VVTSYDQVARPSLERVATLSDGAFAIAPRTPRLTRG